MTEEELKAARMEILNSIRAYMADKGITQATAAEKMGITANNMSRIFSGKYSPSLDTMIALRVAVGLSADWPV